MDLPVCVACRVHGLPNRAPFLGRLHRLVDWTNGCIAVTNQEMRQIWKAVPDGTPIEILGDGGHGEASSGGPHWPGVVIG